MDLRSTFPSRVQLTQHGAFRVLDGDVHAARLDLAHRTVLTACGFSADIDGDIPPASSDDVPVTCEKCKKKGEP
ncbi:hypothetical protein ACIRPH_31300 [Nocardiopsis sp. NPDC101807]|uniref:hypothetical protein n=1 Tax=Nocardiopsis sp. NPDC101807 TaxID=3364339 RepID=UPI0037FC44F7